MSLNFLIPFILLAYGLLISAVVIYGLKTNSTWSCLFIPTALCKEHDAKKYNYTMKNYNVYMMFFLFLFMFYLNYQCYTEQIPYYTFFMISALALIISFFYLGMQLFVMSRKSYWVINMVLICCMVFIFSIRQLIHLQPPA